jgi:acyl carrier protein
MTSDDARVLLRRLLHAVAPEVDLDEIDPAEPLQEAAELDSMDFLNLVTALYDETGIDVPERDYPFIATIDGFVVYVTAASAKSHAVSHEVNAAASTRLDPWDHEIVHTKEECREGKGRRQDRRQGPPAR